MAETCAGGEWTATTSILHRFGGRLQLDSNVAEVEASFALVEVGELHRSERCARVWLGASDLQEEVVLLLLRLLLRLFFLLRLLKHAISLFLVPFREFGEIQSRTISWTCQRSGVPARSV